MRLRAALPLVGALACEPSSKVDTGSPTVDTGPTHPCLEAGADCTLAETARARGVHAGAAVPNGVDEDRQQAVLTHFDSVTAENAMKWGAICPTHDACDFERADAFVDWAHSAGLRIRGHALVWGQSPGHGHPGDLDELTAEADDPETVMASLITEHIQATVARYAGRVESWDVINEPLSPGGSGMDESVFFEAMGSEYINHALEAAHAADPDARLFINEYVVSDYGGEKAQNFVALLEELLAQGAPLHGAGIQAHLYVEVPDPDVLGALIHDIAALGLDVELTEIDMARTALLEQTNAGMELFDAQAEAYGVLAEACLAEPRCTGLTTWGIDDSHSWLDSTAPYDALAPNAPLLLDEHLEPKPAYLAVRELLAVGAQ